jgi:hypothetical protein
MIDLRTVADGHDRFCLCERRSAWRIQRPGSKGRSLGL